VSVESLTGFAGAVQEAVAAVLDAVVTVGEDRRAHMNKAKLAVGKALHDAQNGDEWFLAEHIRRGIKDVEARTRDAA
jgi:hypothetical protein